MIGQIGVISDHYRMLVLLIPKCASSTLRQEFQSDLYRSYEEWIETWPVRLESYRKFVFLRHPVDRFFSAYATVYDRHIGRALYNARNGIVEDRPLEFLNMEDTILTIFEFLEHIRTFGFFDPHLRPQSQFVSGHSIEACYPVEHALQGINAIREKLGLPKKQNPLPRINKFPTHKGFSYVKEAVPAALIHEIRQLYADDIRLYERYFGK